MTEKPENLSPSAGRTTLLGIVLIGVLLLAIAILLNLRQSVLATPIPTLPSEMSGITPVDPPMELQNFTMPSSAGEDMRLSDLRGEYALIFFGYSHCPDFCPTTLADFTQIKAALGDSADQLKFIFVSVDAERDTPEVLEEYMSRFDPEFIGLQGVESTLTQIAGDYGLDYVLHTDEADEDGNYAVDHTTATYLIDRQGRLRAIFSYSTDRDTVVAYIRSIMQADSA